VKEELKKIIDEMDEDEVEVWYRIITSGDDVLRELFWSLVTGDEQDVSFLEANGFSEEEIRTFLSLIDKLYV